MSNPHDVGVQSWADFLKAQKSYVEKATAENALALVEKLAIATMELNKTSLLRVDFGAIKAESVAAVYRVLAHLSPVDFSAAIPHESKMQPDVLANAAVLPSSLIMRERVANPAFIEKIVECGALEAIVHLLVCPPPLKHSRTLLHCLLDSLCVAGAPEVTRRLLSLKPALPEGKEYKVPYVATPAAPRVIVPLGQDGKAPYMALLGVLTAVVAYGEEFLAARAARVLAFLVEHSDRPQELAKALLVLGPAGAKAGAAILGRLPVTSPVVEREATELPLFLLNLLRALLEFAPEETLAALGGGEELVTALLKVNHQPGQDMMVFMFSAWTLSRLCLSERGRALLLSHDWRFPVTPQFAPTVSKLKRSGSSSSSSSSSSALPPPLHMLYILGNICDRGVQLLNKLPEGVSAAPFAHVYIRAREAAVELADYIRSAPALAKALPAAEEGKKKAREWRLALRWTQQLNLAPARAGLIDFEEAAVGQQQQDLAPPLFRCSNPECKTLADVFGRDQPVRCDRCKAHRPRYCSAACQRAHWKAHKPFCAGTATAAKKVAAPAAQQQQQQSNTVPN